MTDYLNSFVEQYKVKKGITNSVNHSHKSYSKNFNNKNNHEYKERNTLKILDAVEMERKNVHYISDESSSDDDNGVPAIPILTTSHNPNMMHTHDHRRHNDGHAVIVPTDDEDLSTLTLPTFFMDNDSRAPPPPPPPPPPPFARKLQHQQQQPLQLQPSRTASRPLVSPPRSNTPTPSSPLHRYSNNNSYNQHIKNSNNNIGSKIKASMSASPPRSPKHHPHRNSKEFKEWWLQQKKMKLQIPPPPPPPPMPSSPVSKNKPSSSHTHNGSNGKKKFPKTPNSNENKKGDMNPTSVVPMWSPPSTSSSSSLRSHNQGRGVTNHIHFIEPDVSHDSTDDVVAEDLLPGLIDHESMVLDNAATPSAKNKNIASFRTAVIDKNNCENSPTKQKGQLVSPLSEKKNASNDQKALSQFKFSHNRKDKNEEPQVSSPAKNEIYDGKFNYKNNDEIKDSILDDTESEGDDDSILSFVTKEFEDDVNEEDEFETDDSLLMLDIKDSRSLLLLRGKSTGSLLSTKSATSSGFSWISKSSSFLLNSSNETDDENNMNNSSLTLSSSLSALSLTKNTLQSEVDFATLLTKKKVGKEEANRDRQRRKESAMRRFSCCQIQRIVRGMQTRHALLHKLGIAKRRKWEPKTKSPKLTNMHSNIRRAARNHLRQLLPIRSSMIVAIRTVCAIKIQLWWLSRQRKIRTKKKYYRYNHKSRFYNSLEQKKYVIIKIQAISRAFIYRQMFTRELRLRHSFSSEVWKQRKYTLGEKMLQLQSQSTQQKRSLETQSSLSNFNRKSDLSKPKKSSNGKHLKNTKLVTARTTSTKQNKTQISLNEKKVLSSRHHGSSNIKSRNDVSSVEEDNGYGKSLLNKQNGHNNKSNRNISSNTKRFSGRLNTLAKKLTRESSSTNNKKSVTADSKPDSTPSTPTATTRRALTLRRRKQQEKKKKKQQPMLGDPEVNALLPDPLSLYRPPSPSPPNVRVKISQDKKSFNQQENPTSDIKSNNYHSLEFQDNTTVSCETATVSSSTPTLPNQVALSPCSQKSSCSEMSSSTTSSSLSFTHTLHQHHLRPSLSRRGNNNSSSTIHNNNLSMRSQQRNRILHQLSIFNDQYLDDIFPPNKNVERNHQILQRSHFRNGTNLDNDIPSINSSNGNKYRNHINKDVSSQRGFTKSRNDSRDEDIPFDEI